MKATKKANETMNLNGADERLTALLQSYKVESYEKREKSNGSSKLYVRLTKIQPMVQLMTVQAGA